MVVFSHYMPEFMVSQVHWVGRISVVLEGYDEIVLLTTESVVSQKPLSRTHPQAGPPQLLLTQDEFATHPWTWALPGHLEILSDPHGCECASQPQLLSNESEK